CSASASVRTRSWFRTSLIFCAFLDRPWMLSRKFLITARNMDFIGFNLLLASPLKSAGQEQNDQYDYRNADDSRWGITIRVITPAGEAAYQKQNQNNQQ